MNTNTESADALRLLVVFDSTACQSMLETGWGFSVVVTGREKTILFDTGPGEAVVRNLERLGLCPAEIDVVVLSHKHADHTTGVSYVLANKNEMQVYVPRPFPKTVKEKVRVHGGALRELAGPTEICDGVRVTGPLGWTIKEQALVVETAGGAVVVVGCGHCGLGRIVDAVERLTGGRILLVLGGFHLEWSSKRAIERIIQRLDRKHVRYVGPAHCCGEKAKRLFREHFGPGYLEVAAGRQIRIQELV